MPSSKAIRALVAIWALALVTALGCAPWPPDPNSPGLNPFGEELPPPSNNPLFVPNVDRDLVWENLIDVVDDYFKILREDRVQLVGDTLTEGRIETYPRGASTLSEPWGVDSVTQYDKLESTLQSERRTGTIRVIPANGGFLVEVVVLKDLEDVGRPEHPSPGRLNLRNDAALHRLGNSVGGGQPTLGWIAKGRDVSLEQTILAKIQQRLGGVGEARAFKPTQ